MLVSVAELRQALNGVKFTEGEAKTAALLLSGIQQELEVHLNRPVEPVVVTEHATSDLNGYCRLSVTPMIRVISVSRNRTNSRFLDYEMNPAERPEYMAPYVGAPGSFSVNWYEMIPGGISTVSGTNLAVTYVGGLDGGAVGIKAKILEIASRSWGQRNSSAVALRDGNAAPAEGFSGPLGWLPEEKFAFDRFRRRVVR